MGKIPNGVVAILVSKNGNELASVTDFNRTTPGGFTLLEAQKSRARETLATKAMKELSSPLLSDSISQYHARGILSEMCDRGCKIIFVPVGYDEEVGGG